MVREGIVLGHKVSSKGVEVDKNRTELIDKLQLPSDMKGMKILLVMLVFTNVLLKNCYHREAFNKSS